MKIFKNIARFFRNIYRIIDKKIIIPVTKLVLAFTNKFDRSGKKVEGWLSKSTTLLFISLFLAIIMFVVVDQRVLLFSENSAEVLTDQPVKVIYNEEAYVVEGLPEKVDITLIGSSADLYFAKQSSAQEVTIDLTGLKPGQHRVNIKYNQVLPSISYQVNPSVATIYIYPKVSETKTLAVDLLNQDSLNSTLVINRVNVTNDKVVVKGADYKLQQVAIVKALVDVKNIVNQEVGTATLQGIPLRAYDEHGDVVDVEIVPSTIDADIEIASPSKELPIRVIPTGDVSFGKAINSIVVNETTVIVYGEESVLEDLRYIPIEVDVTGLKENRQYKLELPKPVGVRSMSVNNVTIDITLDQSIDYEIENVHIEPRNLGAGYTVQGITADDIQVSVVLKGVKNVVEQITADDITAYIDLEGYGVGEHEVDVYVEGTDSKVQYVAKTKKVKVRITKSS